MMEDVAEMLKDTCPTSLRRVTNSFMCLINSLLRLRCRTLNIVWLNRGSLMILRVVTIRFGFTINVHRHYGYNPGPAWAKVKPHNDAEYGHQNGELSFWAPLTDRILTVVYLWSESVLFWCDWFADVIWCYDFETEGRKCRASRKIQTRKGWQTRENSSKHHRRIILIRIII